MPEPQQYASLGEVMRETGYAYDERTIPTIQTVEGFLRRHANWLQYQLTKLNVTLPIDSLTISYDRLRDFHAIRTAIDALSETIPTDDDEQQRITKRIELLQTQVEEIQEALQLDTFNFLEDVERTLSGVPSSIPDSLVSSIESFPEPLWRIYNTKYVNTGQWMRRPGDPVLRRR